MSEHRTLVISEALAERAENIQREMEDKTKGVPGLSNEFLAGHIERLESLSMALITAVISLETELVQTNSQLAQVTAKIL